MSTITSKIMTIENVNCINQQEAYRKVSDYLKKFDNIKVFDIATDDFVQAYDKINDILNITLQ